MSWVLTVYCLVSLRIQTTSQCLYCVVGMGKFVYRETTQCTTSHGSVTTKPVLNVLVSHNNQLLCNCIPCVVSLCLVGTAVNPTDLMLVSPPCVCMSNLSGSCLRWPQIWLAPSRIATRKGRPVTRWSLKSYQLQFLPHWHLFSLSCHMDAVITIITVIIMVII